MNQVYQAWLTCKNWRYLVKVYVLILIRKQTSYANRKSPYANVGGQMPVCIQGVPVSIQQFPICNQRCIFLTSPHCLFAYGDSYHQIPICNSLHVGIPVCILGSPYAFLYAYGDSPVTNSMHKVFVCIWEFGSPDPHIQKLHMGIPLDPCLHRGLDC